MNRVGIAVLLLVLARVGRADIFEWQDAEGVRHFTNLRAEVPAEQRNSAQVVVDEQARWPGGADPASNVGSVSPAGGGAPPTRDDAPARPQAQVIYDRSRLTEAYLEGIERGLEAAAAERISAAGGGGGGAVQINGPLAVASTPAVTPAYGYAWPYYYPFVTTSFDGGRSRHLTLRLLLQDQFAVDRDGPFFFEERFPSPGPRLHPFMPRGLPHFFPREARVLTR